jgi:hypothetical protein
VSYAGGRLRVHGARQVIAQVGAELVRRGEIPDDLTVTLPNLESALLGLLAAADPVADPATDRTDPTTDRELSGAAR